MATDIEAKPYILVDGCPCVISVAYVTGGGPGEWGGIRYIGEYTCMKELNKDMPEFIRGIPSPHWRIEIDFQDYVSLEELEAVYE